MSQSAANLRQSAGGRRYVVESRLGAGGMAEVFRARQYGAEGFSRPVALKRIAPALGDDPEFASSFIAEARIAALLAHPNIVGTIDFDRDEQGDLFLAMELVDGADLRRLATACQSCYQRFPLALAAYVVGEVLRALAYAHNAFSSDGQRLCVLHRDVSPHNVLVARTGAVKLADFGIAKATSSAAATHSSRVLGKVAYMSPEQAAGRMIDCRSDLFSVGVVLYELLAGARPLDGSTEPELLAQLISGRLVPLYDRAPDIPIDIGAIATRLLAVRPAERHASASEALEELLSCSCYPLDGARSLAQLVRRLFPRGGAVAAQKPTLVRRLAELGCRVSRAGNVCSPTRTGLPSAKAQPSVGSSQDGECAWSSTGLLSESGQDATGSRAPNGLPPVGRLAAGTHPLRRSSVEGRLRALAAPPSRGPRRGPPATYREYAPSSLLAATPPAASSASVRQTDRCSRRQETVLAGAQAQRVSEGHSAQHAVGKKGGSGCGALSSRMVLLLGAAATLSAGMAVVSWNLPTRGDGFARDEGHLQADRAGVSGYSAEESDSAIVSAGSGAQDASFAPSADLPDAARARSESARSESCLATDQLRARSRPGMDAKAKTPPGDVDGLAGRPNDATLDAGQPKTRSTRQRSTKHHGTQQTDWEITLGRRSPDEIFVEP
ncbi:MAG: serine/threonine-protein kinase [Pseudomonadota bacterium]